MHIITLTAYKVLYRVFLPSIHDLCPQTSSPISAWILGEPQLAIHDAYFSIRSFIFKIFLTRPHENHTHRLQELFGALKRPPANTMDYSTADCKAIRNST